MMSYNSITCLHLRCMTPNFHPQGDRLQGSDCISVRSCPPPENYSALSQNKKHESQTATLKPTMALGIRLGQLSGLAHFCFNFNEI